MNNVSSLCKLVGINMCDRTEYKFYSIKKSLKKFIQFHYIFEIYLKKNIFFFV